MKKRQRSAYQPKERKKTDKRGWQNNPKERGKKETQAAEPHFYGSTIEAFHETLQIL
jgi:hypothetical protein